ncbi:hypothetical protein FBEOM_9339 [Fusarium beomiforme]|uniref:Mid2 domain-containing protein n=1 Tax=Fusarium beomiforme TaxID=44412 RepID=A0A9P5ADM9_9HYPO|nr:hypothetical protein FBEOM_9339 [Fusarium beomiforme]
MFLGIILFGLVWSTQPSLVHGNFLKVPNDVLPGYSEVHKEEAMPETSASSGLQRRDTQQQNRTSLDKTWKDAVLFAFEAEQDVDSKKGNASISAGIEITCAVCYIKGIATTKFIHDKDFNISHAFDNFTDRVESGISSLATNVKEYVEEYIHSVSDNLEDGFDVDDFDLPSMDFDFNIEIPEIPEFRLQFQFDGLEVYMQLDTTLSAGATYTLNLYKSTTPAGFAVRDNLEIGVIFTLDLILSVDGEIDISSGFHLKLDDGVKLELGIFAKEISSITINGGEFEFLPVTIDSAGVVFKAILRVGVQAGVEIASPEISVAGKDIARVGAGAEVGVYANIAELITNVTLSLDEDDECSLRVEEAYQFAIGAVAGASIVIQEYTWGPVPETEVPIFYTTLADACAVARNSGTISASQVAITSAPLQARDDDEDDNELETTTISTKATFTVVACESEGLVNCPASLQKTSKYTTTRTHVTVVPSNSEAEFPDPVRYTVTSPIPFGEAAKKLVVTSGVPVSYVPPTTTSSAKAGSKSGDDSDANSDQNGKTGGVPTRVIIGLSVGLGVPFLLGILASIL